MFIRGSGSGIESKRVDISFYRGVVVKNDDPLKLCRVKVYIPELSNQPFDDWFEKYDAMDIKAPGKNNTTDAWKDIKIFEEIAANIPWAEPCYPLFGESGPSRYYKSQGIATISDCNYPEGFLTIDTKAPTVSSGSFAPAFLYESWETPLGDAFTQPLVNYSVKCNPYGFSYKSNKYSNKTKGMIGIPEVGSKIWVFHDIGNLNFPIYFGVAQDFRGLTLVNNTDNKSKISPTYPSDFEN